jgi:hypothetical protein
MTGRRKKKWAERREAHGDTLTERQPEKGEKASAGWAERFDWSEQE